MSKNYLDTFTEDDVSKIIEALSIDDKASIHLKNLLQGIINRSAPLMYHSTLQLISNINDENKKQKVLTIFYSSFMLNSLRYDKYHKHDSFYLELKQLVMNIIEDKGSLTSFEKYMANSDLSDLQKRGEAIISPNKLQSFYKYLYTEYNNQMMEVVLNIIELFNLNTPFINCFKYYRASFYYNNDIFKEIMLELSDRSEDFFTFVQVQQLDLLNEWRG